MKLLLKVHGERTARNRRTPERTTYTASPQATRINSSSSSSSSNSSSANSNNNSSSSSKRSSKKSRRLTRNTLLLSLLLLLVLFTALFIVYMELQRGSWADTANNTDKAILFGNEYKDGTFPNLGNGHLIIERHQWGASEKALQLTVPLHQPIPYVLITHIGVQSIPCSTLYKCSIKMRSTQDSAIAEKSLPDIQSNFYVSDDGNIYVGRGWDWANTYSNHTLSITFMGDYERYTPTPRQLEGVQYLLAHAVANQKLDVKYKLVAQNQTKETKSPGANVYRQIQKWSHFYGCSRNEKAICGHELGMTAASWNAGQ